MSSAEATINLPYFGFDNTSRIFCRLGAFYRPGPLATYTSRSSSALSIHHPTTVSSAVLVILSPQLRENIDNIQGDLYINLRSRDGTGFVHVFGCYPRSIQFALTSFYADCPHRRII